MTRRIIQGAAGNAAAGGGGGEAVSPNAYNLDYLELGDVGALHSAISGTPDVIFTTAQSVAVSSDGTKFYFVSTSPVQVTQLTLSTAYDFRTVSESAPVTYSLSQGTSPYVIRFGDSGTKFYVIFDSNDTIFQYNLSTAWDLSTASYASKSLVVSGNTGGGGRAFDISSDGTKLIAPDPSSSRIHYYDLSTAWDLSTASVDVNKKADFNTVVVEPLEPLPKHWSWNSDGTALYASNFDTNTSSAGTTRNVMVKLSLSTAWDPSSWQYDMDVVNIGSNWMDFVYGIGFFCFNDDYTKMFICTDNISNGVAMFNLATAGDITTMTRAGGAYYNIELVCLDGTREAFDTEAKSFDISSDGTRLYLYGKSNDRVMMGEMSTAYDLSTIKYFTGHNESLVTDSQFVRLGGDNDQYIWGANTSTLYRYELTNGKYIGEFVTQQAEYSRNVYSNTNVMGSSNFQGIQWLDSGNVCCLYAAGWMMVQEVTTPYDVRTIKPHAMPFSSSVASTITQGINWSGDGYDVWLNAASYISHYKTSTPFQLDETTLAMEVVQLPQYDVDTTNTNNFSFADNGNLMYSVGESSDIIIKNRLSTPYDVSTASVLQVYDDTTSIENTPQQVVVSPDGTKLFLTGSQTDDIKSYTMSTAHDLSTLSYDGASYDLYVYSDGVVLPYDMQFKPDGTKLYVCGNGSARNIIQYNLSTAWDLSTATYVAGIKTSSNCYGFQITSDGTTDGARITYNDGNKIIQAKLTTAWDLSTMKIPVYYVQNIVNTIATNDGRVFWKSDGTEFYHYDIAGRKLYTWTVDIPYSLTGVSADSGTNVTGESVIYHGNYATNNKMLFFKPDGTKMYMGGDYYDKIFQFSLSTAWDVSTTSYDGELALGTTYPNCACFSSDGTVLMVSDYSSDKLFVKDLTTAWDVTGTVTDNTSYSTSSAYYALVGNNIQAMALNNNGKILTMADDSWMFHAICKDDTAYDFSHLNTVSGTDNYRTLSMPSTDVVFNADGTKFFRLDMSTRVITSYNLSTAWDTTTNSSAVATFNVLTYGGLGDPVSLEFKPDGTVMYVCDWRDRIVYSYNLSTAWDLTSLGSTYDNSYDFTTQLGYWNPTYRNAYPYSIRWSHNGNYLFVLFYTSGDSYILRLTAASA